LLVLYYRDDDENKSSGLKIAGWILASPGLFFLAIGLIYVFFSR
jgi:formate hydrogenlyase subunit 3/multisubunit Na+/H+ antiporter MnhD subunit